MHGGPSNGNRRTVGVGAVIRTCAVLVVRAVLGSTAFFLGLGRGLDIFVPVLAGEIRGMGRSSRAGLVMHLAVTYQTLS